jgi:hypothetical protein
LFNTKKSNLSIVYYQEIYEIWWTLAGYHLKSKNSLKRDGMTNIIQAHLSQIKKYQSHSINNAYIRFSKTISSHKNWDLQLLCAVSSHLIVFIYWSLPCQKCSTLRWHIQEIYRLNCEHQTRMKLLARIEYWLIWSEQK